MIDSRKTKMLAVLFTLTYMVSYITRINYGAIISEIETSTQLPRSILSMAVSGSFITYGLGQIVSGICGDRFSPKRLVQLGLTVTVFMNLLMPLCASPYQMLAVWCVNGFAQAFMWPPIVRIMVAAFSKEDYKKMAVRISWASSYGTIIIYFVAPILITLWNWKSVFWFSALCGAVMLFVWSKFCIDVNKSPHETNGSAAKVMQKDGLRVLFAPVVIGIMLAIILQGMLRDGVSTWMPSYIASTYHFSTAASILTGVVLPLFSILCTQIASVIYRKKWKSPVLCSTVMFAVGLISAVGLYACSGSNAALSVISAAMLTGTMHGVSSMLTAMVPPYFERYGNVSTASGVLNACAYIGSGISTFGIAVLSEQLGWQFTLLTWCMIALCGTLVCFICTRPWKRKFQSIQNGRKEQ